MDYSIDFANGLSDILLDDYEQTSFTISSLGNNEFLQENISEMKTNNYLQTSNISTPKNFSGSFNYSFNNDSSENNCSVPELANSSIYNEKENILFNDFSMDNDKNISISLFEEDSDDTYQQILEFVKNNNIMEKYHERQYGKQILHEKKFQKGKRRLPNNKFLQNHEELLEFVLYFDKDICSFISKRVLRLKKRILLYGQILINEIINQKDKQLIEVDYNDVIERNNKEFDLKLMDKKLFEIFVEFQNKKRTNELEHNKNIIKYINDNTKDNNKAYYLLNLTFENLLKLFIEDENNGLKCYLTMVRKSMDSTYKKNKILLTEDDIRFNNEKINALCYIDKTLCLNLKEYFEKIDQRRNGLLQKK